MYSENNEKICSLCVHSRSVKGTVTHVACEKRGGYVPCRREACTFYEYDIFKRPVRRRKPAGFGEFSKEDFIL